MRIALAQINPTLGDFKGNSSKILEFSRRAAEKRADIVVFSELTLFGYPPYDALERPELVEAEEKFIKKIIQQLPSKVVVVFGAVIKNTKVQKCGGKPYQNVAVVAQKGKSLGVFPKELLPTYDVFDEGRFFEPGREIGTILLKGLGRIAFSVCEDMWVNLKEDGHRVYSQNPWKKVKKPDLIINISASPFSKDKMAGRLSEARNQIKKFKVPFVYVNQVGGQDELIFDGRSFILDKAGKEIVQGAFCEEDLVIVDLARGRSEYRPNVEEPAEILRGALVLGIRDFLKKNNLKSLHLGLSGGIDSAVMAALAVDAVGPGQVTGLLLPGPYSSEGSVNDSVSLARNLGIKTYKTDIKKLYEDVAGTAEVYPKVAEGEVFKENIQARLRGLILMAFSNKSSSLLLSTANKCELATGYSTLYGDMCGGLMPLGDLTKGEIYALAKIYNRDREVIPQEIIDKAPSAELAPHQKDSDTLPPYDVLDKAVVAIVEEKRPARNEVERWLVKALKASEFKRWQAPPILRISKHGFGPGRRIPITLKLS